MAASSAEAQKLGHVLISNMRSYEIYLHYDRTYSRDCAKMQNYLPMNFVTAHIIVGHGHAALRDVIAPILKYIHGKRMRLRSVVHLGDNQQVTRDLATYGIVAEKLPVGLGGALRTGECFMQWMIRRRGLESPQD